MVLTGGHAATPAIAVIEKINRRKSRKTELFWIGSREAIPGTNLETIEYKILPEMGVKFCEINAGKIQTKFTRHTIPLILKIPVGFIQSLFLLLKIRPKLVLSFGGYASFPVVFWAYFLRIPVILHEQTVAAGRSSIFSEAFAKKIVLARKESLRFFPRNKSIVVGNPVMADILKVAPKEKPGNPKLILVMGGSRGSQFINESIISVTDVLLQKFRIVHITGQNEYEKVSGYRNSLSTPKAAKYRILPFVDPREMSGLYESADIVVSRSGASTVSEIMAVKRPAILIPLPRTFMGEQVKNAKYAENFGVAQVLEEQDVTDNSLLTMIDRISDSWEDIVKKVEDKISPDRFAAEKLVDILFKFMLQ